MNSSQNKILKTNTHLLNTIKSKTPKTTPPPTNKNIQTLKNKQTIILGLDL